MKVKLILSLTLSKRIILYECPSMYRSYFTLLIKTEVELSTKELFSMTYYDQLLSCVSFLERPWKQYDDIIGGVRDWFGLYQ